MNYRFSQRILATKASATRGMSDRAAVMVKSGLPVIALSSGEPDFISSPVTHKYANLAMEQGETHYTATAGHAEMKAAAKTYYQQRFGLDYALNEIMVGAGAKPLLYEALGCLVNPGDEVIILTPAWVSYIEQVGLFDGVPVLVDTLASGLEPSLGAISAVVSNKTVALIINSPNNPTGKVYGAEFLLGLANMAKQHGFIIINDELYEQIVFKGHEYHNITQVAPDCREVILNINGMSKAFAMTGWRLGYALGPQPLISKMAIMQGHITSSACTIAQLAAAGTLNEGLAEAKTMSLEYQERKDLVMQLLRDCPLISTLEPEGTFYAFLDIRKTLGKKYQDTVITDDVMFCELLLEKALLALIAGTSFLAPGYVRLSFAASRSDLSEGIKRLQGFLQKLN